MSSFWQYFDIHMEIFRRVSSQDYPLISPTCRHLVAAGLSITDVDSFPSECTVVTSLPLICGIDCSYRTSIWRTRLDTLKVLLRSYIILDILADILVLVFNYEQHIVGASLDAATNAIFVSAFISFLYRYQI